MDLFITGDVPIGSLNFDRVRGSELSGTFAFSLGTRNRVEAGTGVNNPWGGNANMLQLRTLLHKLTQIRAASPIWAGPERRSAKAHQA